MSPKAAADSAADHNSFSLLVENDSFGNSDRHYTNGLKASILLKKDKLKGFSRWLADALPLFPDHGERRIGFAEQCLVDGLCRRPRRAHT